MVELDPSQFVHLRVEHRDDGVSVVMVNRPEKRNALNLATIDELVTFFTLAPRAGVRAVLLAGAGDHFCAGLDLVEHHQADRSPSEFWQVCLRWHEAFNKMEYGGLPIIAALQGAVVGGGLELASAAHIRVMDDTTYFALPEGQRGLFTGGGATIRVAQLVGKARMIDMMLTGRVHQPHAEYVVIRCGLCRSSRRRCREHSAGGPRAARCVCRQIRSSHATHFLTRTRSPRTPTR